MSITFYAGEKEANFSNSNAYLLMQAMGIEPDCCGSMGGSEFNRRAWTAYTADDLTLSQFVRPTTIESNFISCGLDLQDIRDRLLRLASFGADNEVHWG